MWLEPSQPAAVKISSTSLDAETLENENLLSERDGARRGFVSKMEDALFVPQTRSERIPWGGISCANLLHNDWNAVESKP